jgi:exonuclease SbcC
MLIVQIELQNFKSYAHAVIPVEPGTNAIVGANGAGKSSLLEAVGFCLFDASPSGFTFANMLREGAAAGHVVVTIVSSEDERLYEVERRFSGSATTRYRVYDVELGRAIIAEGKEDALAWIRQHLQMEPTAKLDDFFENTIGVPQGTFTAPFLQAAGARKPIFDPILQVDDYRKASDGLRPTTQLLDRRARTLSEEIARAEGQLDILPALEAELETLAGSIAMLTAQEQALLGELREADLALARHDVAEKALSECASRLEAVRAQERALGQRLEDALRALAEAQEAAAVAHETRAGHAAFVAADALLGDLQRRRDRRDTLLAQRAALDRERATSAVRQQHVSLSLREIEDAATALHALNPQVAEQTHLEDALRDAERACAQREQSEREVEALAGQVREAETEAARMAEAVLRASEIDARLAALQEKLAGQRLAQRAADARLAAAGAEVERLEAQSAMLSDVEVARCPVCEAELTPDHRDDLLERNTARLAELEADRQATLGAAAVSEREATLLETESRRLQRERGKLAGEPELERARARLADQQARIEVARLRWQALAEAPQRREALQTQLAALDDPRGQARLHEARLAQRPAALAEAQRLDALLADLESRMAAVDADLADYATLDDDLAAAQVERETHRAAHERHLAHARLADQVEARQGRMSAIEGEHYQAVETLATLEQAVREAEAQYDREAHRAARERAGQLRDGAVRLSAQRGEQEARQHVATQQAGDLRALSDELALKRAEQDEVKALRSLVRLVRDLLRQAGPYVTRQLVHRISHEASALYADIMGDHSGRLHWSEDYDLSLEVRGNRRVFRQLSGGEQMCAALALRLALLREMSRIDIAFFDEPTTNLDAERREGLADRIMRVRGFGQLFVISHDDTFERTAQNYIRIVKDAAGSRVERA